MKYLFRTFRRELRRLTSRTVYLFAMIIVPLGCAIFFLTLLNEGLPMRSPTAIVDLDHSTLSRQITRELASEQPISILEDCESYSDALQAVREGRVFGFFVIPEDFERNTIGGRQPSISYYCNMTYFVPGTFVLKGFKTIAVTTTAGMVRMQLSAIGAPSPVTGALIQPVSFQLNGPGNPWTNYSYYLTPSFMIGVLALMIMLTTVFAITDEIKNRTAPIWLRKAGGSIIAAVSGKLLPQTVIFCIVGWCIMSLMYGFFLLPVAGNIWVLVACMPLFVIANQSLALLICSVIPNPRLAFSAVALTGILTFSFAGFSFPVESMYGAIGILSYIVPARHFFLMHINEVLWGAPLYYMRLEIISLLLFPLAAIPVLPLLKRACKRQIYVP